MHKLLLPLALFATIGPALAQSIGEADLRAHIAVLASDDYEGREPGTEGETKAAYYIAKQWYDAGLSSGSAGDLLWYQPVDLVTRTRVSGEAQFYRAGQPVDLSAMPLLWTGEGAAQSLAKLPLVFVGYGADADGKAIGDVDGKIAVMLASNAPYMTEPLSFRARQRLLAGAGAKGVLLLIGPEIPFAAVERSLSGGTTGLASAAAAVDGDPPVRGYASQAQAGALFADAGRSMSDLVEAAASPDFTAVPLGLAADVETRGTSEPFTSYNVVAKLPGRDPASGAVLFLGHWDHLGICRDESAEDRICNGAVDNASGIAVLIEVAKRLGAGPRLDRDVYFLATTAEELGLLGARAFADNPPLPLDSIVAALNIDTIAVAPRGMPVAVIGKGRTPIADDVEKVARELGRAIDADDDANAFIGRQDGAVLLEAGVPAVMAGGSFADIELLESFLSGPYHGPDDELTADTELGGAAEDADLHVALGLYFGDESRYPGNGSGE